MFTIINFLSASRAYLTNRKICFAAIAMGAAVSPATAQSVLFDFNNAPNHTSLPIDLTAGGITAHFAATGQGFSIQDTSAPVVPVGFTGRFIYPNSIYAADLIISFDHTLTDFSILYSPQELGCDDSATMRVTASMNGTVVGFNTKTASNPGTWPVDTLSCSFPHGFNSVVIHYDKKPPTCQDYGVIFLCDDMRVTTHGTNYGSGSTGCNGAQTMVAETAVSVSKPNFTFGATNCPPNSLGLLLVTNVALIPPQDPFFVGALLDVDLIASSESYNYDMFSDATGFGSVTISGPVPPTMVGRTFYVQSLWAWPFTTACDQAGNWHHPYGLSSTNGIIIVIQP
ncbi:MAG: hypothetical protein HY286_12115 [Planctomycetes bacterium]|nr:hypothetical protein [Planctomycetota bacterium]